MIGAPMPVFRHLGFGLFVKGTGQLSGVEGLLSVNPFISILLSAFSNLYVFHFVDPDRTFRTNCIDNGNQCRLESREVPVSAVCVADQP